MTESSLSLTTKTEIAKGEQPTSHGHIALKKQKARTVQDGVHTVQLAYQWLNGGTYP